MPKFPDNIIRTIYANFLGAVRSFCVAPVSLIENFQVESEALHFTSMNGYCGALIPLLGGNLLIRSTSKCYQSVQQVARACYIQRPSRSISRTNVLLSEKFEMWVHISMTGLENICWVQMMPRVAR